MNPSPSAANELNDLVTPTEFRELLRGRIGRNEIYRALNAHRIRHLRIGRKILIPTSECVDWPEREFVGGEL